MNVSLIDRNKYSELVENFLIPVSKQLEEFLCAFYLKIDRNCSKKVPLKRHVRIVIASLMTYFGEDSA